MIDASFDKIRFHMPGHSGENIDGALYQVAPYDLTELSFSDNLAHPTGVLKAVEDKIARIYHAKRAFMLTQGATAGIAIMLLVAREVRGEIFTLGNTHKSCVSYASCIGLKVTHLDSMDEAIRRVGEGDIVYVTTPNYFGEVIDLERLLDARRDGGMVIVDEAHGSHFVFSKLLPTSWCDKADMTVESLHKTLPVFTGGAVLNVNNAKYIDMAEFFKCKIHSTSPSYLIMQSIDSAMSEYERDGDKIYARIYRAIEDFKADLTNSYFSVVDTADFTRLVVRCKDSSAVNDYLESNGIYIELEDAGRLVMIVTAYNMKHLSTLARVLNEYVPCGDNDRLNVESNAVSFHLEKATATAGPLRFVAIRYAVGKVSMNEIAVYPPGVPVVTTGDILTREVIQYIEETREKIVGLIGDTMAVRDLCEEN